MTLPDGPLINVLDRVEAMLADCYWWRRIEDEGSPWDASTAADHIHQDALPPPAGDEYTKAELIALRPFALIWNDTDRGYRLSAGGHLAGGQCSIPSGRVVVEIEINTPSAIVNDPNAVGRYAAKTAGRLVWTNDGAKPAIWDLSGGSGESGTYLYVNDLNVMGHYRSDDSHTEQYGDSLLFGFHLDWGIG